MEGRWVQIKQGSAPLSCWWNNPWKESKHGVLVLPELFGINSWVKRVVDRLAEKVIPALAMPLFTRIEPKLCLGYGEDDLTEERGRRDQTTTQQILDDASHSLTWLKQQYTKSKK